MTQATGALRVAVAGVGHLGSAHAKVYSAMDDVELVAVADVDAEAAARVTARRARRRVRASMTSPMSTRSAWSSRPSPTARWPSIF